MKKIWTIIHAAFSDKDWDADITKIIGFILAVCGVIGFFLAMADWAIMLGIGVTALATGKFSKEG